MKFSISFVALVSTALFAVVHAAPAPLCNGELCSDVAAREVIDVTFDDLAVRAKGKAKAAAPAKGAAKSSAAAPKKKSSGSQKGNISQGILDVQKKQGQKQRTKLQKASNNAKLVQKKTGDIKKTVDDFRTAEKANGKLNSAQLNAKSDKLRNAEKSRVISNNRKDTKTAKTAQYASKKNTPAQKTAKKVAQTARRADRKAKGLPSPANQASTKNRVSKEQKNNVKQRFRAANDKLRKTEGVPGRKDTVSVGSHKTDGRAVRQSAFNSYLHSKTPVGNSPFLISDCSDISTFRQPKNFNNRPYASTHKDAKLANQKAIPQSGKEYPIIDKNPNGWTGQGAVGALRTVTYKQGGKRKLAVVGHDTSRGGDANDHYKATVSPGKRELDLDFEDFE
ncbi:hypothetical protein EST38_g12197 [Candolleomyces aberdarensis]|uniref:Uncharacterized protein n=1 Tax=Candolleomyces aberdarensis TaxID=2316362 RepID=A0A4Q2D652_9AGAR|nr:hypothetical protein EST38_g12197 [Candolleomyces aberdarensis]